MTDTTVARIPGRTTGRPDSTPTPRDNAISLRLCALILYGTALLVAYLEAGGFLTVTLAATIPAIYAFLVFADLAERGVRA